MVNNNKKNTIGFKDFDNHFEIYKLGEIGTTYTGLSGKNKEDFGHGKGKFITYMNVFLNPIAAPYMTEPIEIDDSQNKVQKGDILFTTSSETPEEVGMSSIWLEEETNVYLNSFCFGYRPRVSIYPYYLAYALRSPGIRKKIIYLAQGISRYNISKTKMMDISIAIPKRDEQQKIGDLLKNIDSYINTQQKKYEKLKILKQSLMEKMFLKEEKKVPAVRFFGFNDNWVEYSLDNFGKATSGHSLEKEFSKKGNIKVINIGSFSENNIYRDQGIRVEINKNTATSLLNKNDLAMILNDKTSFGNIIGRVLLIDNDNSYVYNQRTQRIEVEHTKFKPQFLYQLLNANFVRQKIVKSSQGNTQIYVNWSVIKDLKYSIPTASEQQKIGEFFEKLDSLLNLQKSKVEKLKQLKKSLLDKMFV